MSLEDGFQMAKYIVCLNPSARIEASQLWFKMNNRWLVSTIGLEIHHGFVGQSIAQQLSPLSDSTEGSVDSFDIHRLSSKPEVQMAADVNVESGAESEPAMDVDDRGSNTVDRIVSACFHLEDDTDELRGETRLIWLQKWQSAVDLQMCQLYKYKVKKDKEPTENTF